MFPARAVLMDETPVMPRGGGAVAKAGSAWIPQRVSQEGTERTESEEVRRESGWKEMFRNALAKFFSLRWLRWLL